MQPLIRLPLIGLTTLVFTLSGCGDNDDDDEIMMPAPEPAPVTTSYEITVTNLTAAQPLSPVAVMLTGEQRYWRIGEPASDALALLAEAGDNSALLDADGVLATASSASPVGPGDATSVTVSVDGADGVWLTVASMLVNTNDGFTGTTGMSLNDLAVNQSITMTATVYDAGTEQNSEAAGSIPGPADGGEGVSDGREDLDRVFMHAGVVSQDDGLSTSVLTQAHRFDNPAVIISVTRLE